MSIILSILDVFYNNNLDNIIQQLAPESTPSGAQRIYNSLPRQEVLISPKGLERLLDCRGMLLVYVVVVVVIHIRAFTLYTLNCLIYTLGARNELFCAQLLLKQVVEVVVKNPLAFTPYTLHSTLYTLNCYIHPLPLG